MCVVSARFVFSFFSGIVTFATENIHPNADIKLFQGLISRIKVPVINASPQTCRVVRLEGISVSFLPEKGPATYSPLFPGRSAKSRHPFLFIVKHQLLLIYFHCVQYNRIEFVPSTRRRYPPTRVPMVFSSRLNHAAIQGFIRKGASCLSKAADEGRNEAAFFISVPVFLHFEKHAETLPLSVGPVIVP